MKWIPFYTSDFLGATAHLSCSERSTYSLMLILYYEVGPFPLDLVRTYRIIGCESDEQKRVVDYLLTEFFVKTDDGWYQERAEEIRTEQNIKTQKAAESARRMWDVKRERQANAERPHSERSANAKRTLSDRYAIQNQNQNQNQEPEPEPKPEPKSKPEASLPDPSLPACIDGPTFQEWEKNRKALRAPLTPAARQMAIKKLVDMHKRGHDPNAALENSTMNGWRGLFDPAPTAANGRAPPGRKQSIVEQNAQAVATFLARSNPIHGEAERIEDA